MELDIIRMREQSLKELMSYSGLDKATCINILEANYWAPGRAKKYVAANYRIDHIQDIPREPQKRRSRSWIK